MCTTFTVVLQPATADALPFGCANYFLRPLAKPESEWSVCIEGTMGLTGSRRESPSLPCRVAGGVVPIRPARTLPAIRC